MHENEAKDKTKLNEKLDSYSIGTSGKLGAIKVYFNLEKMTDVEVIKLVKRAKELYNLVTE